MAEHWAEICCDESGFSGSNLLHVATPMMAHASVDLCVDEAAELIAALRPDPRRPLSEFKSGQLFRGGRAGDSLAGFLEALNGRAHVQLIDKEYFLVTRIVDLFLVEPSYAAGTRLTQHQRPAALTLFRARRRAGRDWDVFLAAFVKLVRTKHRPEPDRGIVERFFQARDSLRSPARRGGRKRPGGLGSTRVWSVLTRMADDDRSIPPPLEPMIPALAETALFSSGDTGRCW